MANEPDKRPATKKTLTPLFYTAGSGVPHPNSGDLAVFGHKTRDLYIPNGAVKHLRTHVTVELPKGVTIEIRGVESLLCQGIHIVPLVYHGPTKISLVLSVHNMSHATRQLNAGQVVASIRATKTVPPLDFQPVLSQAPLPDTPVEEVPVSEEDKQAARSLMGDASDDADDTRGKSEPGVADDADKKPPPLPPITS